MLKKISVSTGLLVVLAVFCLFQVVTEGIGFWSLTSTHADVSNLSDIAQFLDSNNIQTFLDQPTQGFQDRYLAEQRTFANFSDAASQSYLDSIDARLNLFRGVGLAIFVALVAGVVLVHIALRRGVIA